MAVVVDKEPVALVGPPTAAPTFINGTLLRQGVRRGVRARYFASSCVACVRHMCEASLPEPTWSVCAGAYAFGTLGSNECPTNYIRIEAEGACQIAAAAAGQGYQGSETESGYPRGCYSTSLTSGSRGVFFNMATTGAGQSKSKLLCSGARFLARPSWVLFVYTPGYLLVSPT